MSNILAQLILAARDDNGESAGWIQIIFFVVVAIFYVLGNITKARTNKPNKQDKKQPIGRYQQPQMQCSDKQSSPQSQGHPPRRKTLRHQHQPTIQSKKPDIETRPIIQLETKGLPKKSELSLPTPQFQPIFKDLKISGKTSQVEHAAEYASELLLDCNDPDKLKRAILHYEILGKPLSLRD